MKAKPIFKHYRRTQAMARALYLSGADFEDRAICGNGSFHAYLTTRIDHVDCPDCKRRAESLGLIGHLTYGDVYVVVAYNGFYVSVNGRHTSIADLRELDASLADKVRPTVKAICETLGYADLSML